MAFDTVTLKSLIETITVVGWTIGPLTAVMATVKLLAVIVPAALTVSVDVASPLPKNTMLGGLSENVGPPGEAVPVRFTVPVKSLKLVTVIVDEPDEPGVRASAAGLGDMPKSGPATTVTVVVCMRNPLVPVTFTT